MNRIRVVVLAALTALAFLFLWEQVQAVRVGYEVGRARKELRLQSQTVVHLRMQLARLRAPERIAREAETRLRMTPPTPESQIFLGRALARGGEGQGLLSFLIH
ncbi:MAG: hypothetical protein WC969_02725 [Elusimicrobiota bacterium]|jgi:cell division protein FtsL